MPEAWRLCEAKQCLSTSPCLSGLSSLFTISPSTQTKRPIWGGWRKRNDGGSLQLIRRSGAARLHRGARRTKRAGKPSLCLWSGTGGEEDREREDASHPILAAGLSFSPFFFFQLPINKMERRWGPEDCTSSQADRDSGGCPNGSRPRRRRGLDAQRSGARQNGPDEGGNRPTLCALTQGAERGDCAGGERERGATEGTENDRRNTAEANQEADRSG